MTYSSAKLPDVKIPRNIRLRYERFLDHFKGFEDVDAVRGIFGPRTKTVLSALKVEFFSSKWGYMGVSDEDGHLGLDALPADGQPAGYLSRRRARTRPCPAVQRREAAVPGGLQLPGCAHGDRGVQGVHRGR